MNNVPHDLSLERFNDLVNYRTKYVLHVVVYYFVTMVEMQF